MVDSAPNPLPVEPSLGVMGWVAGYKLVKALLAGAGTLLVLHLLHRDLAKVAIKWMQFFGIDEQGHLASRLLSHLAHVDPRRLHLLAIILFGYTLLYITEGVGLMLRRRWAEWLTIVQTAAWVPVELYELARHAGWIKAAVLALNLAVIAYLLWRIRREKRVHKTQRALLHSTGTTSLSDDAPSAA